MKTKAVAYARYSSENQKEESIIAQIMAIEDYAKNNNIEIIEKYIDRAKSGTTTNRPEFLRMIKNAKSGCFEAIIVHKLDRFSRDKYDSAIYKRDLKLCNVSLISVLEKLDDSPESMILESLIEAMNQYYSANLKREVMKVIINNAKECKHTGGIPLLGYNVDPKTKKYIINSQEAEAVKIIFKMYSEGYGYNRIITSLNEKGYRTKRNLPFGKNSLHEILTNEKYTGVYIYNKCSKKNYNGKRNNHSHKSNDQIIRIVGGMPSIISEDIFTKIQVKIANNKHRNARKKAKEFYLLSGLIFCGKCGHAMVGNVKYSGKNKTKYITYRCSCRDLKKSCNNKEIRKDYLEPYIINQLKNEIFSVKNIPYLLKEINKRQESKISQNDLEIKSLKNNQLKIQKQITNILNALKDGIAHNLITKELDNLQEQETKINQKIAEYSIKKETTTNIVDEKTIRQLIKRFNECIDNNNIVELKEFVNQYVEKVTIYEDNIKVVFSYYIIVVLNGKGTNY